ncbi:MAG: hypothetical protein AAF416_22920 [Pseudomonadota bacterium]
MRLVCTEAVTAGLDPATGSADRHPLMLDPKVDPGDDMGGSVSSEAA